MYIWEIVLQHVQLARRTSGDRFPSGQDLVPRMLTYGITGANTVMVRRLVATLRTNTSKCEIGQKPCIPQNASVHPAVMGTWWNDKRKMCSMASAAENAMHSSQEDETVYE
jgi:hypothetical protein